jgi:hypothetical protein
MKDESIVWDHGFKIFNYKTQEDIKKIVEDFSEFLIEKGIALWTLARQNKPEDRFLIEAGPTFDKVAQDFRTKMVDSVEDFKSFAVLDCGVAFPLSVRGNFANVERSSAHVLDLTLADGNILIDPEYKNIYIVWKSVVVGTEKYESRHKVGQSWVLLDQRDLTYWKSHSSNFNDWSKWRTYCSEKYDLKEASEDTQSIINVFLSVRGLARLSFLPRAIYINTNKEIIIVSDLEGGHWLCTPLSQFRFKEENPPFDRWNWDSKLNTWEKNIKEKTMATLMNYVGAKIPRTGEFASKVSDFKWDSPNVMAALTCAVLTKNNGL